MYSKPIDELIQAFSRLPSVGERTAERFVFYLLKSGKKDVAEMTLSLKNLIEEIKSCEVCWDFTDESPCSICADEKRDKSTICIVQEPQNLQAIEKTGDYNGLYHVLRGTLKPGHDLVPRYLKINELLSRVKKPETKEVILALNPDLNGETTMMFLEKRIKDTNPQVKVSRLARGLAMGSDLQYADEITLGSALKNRI
ncbi:MAG: recombination protein RecR [Candidatus Magasanikbacteria bacterium]|jgi:recombination protein RecR|nr:recombination protein RecR [Candidatus Magasanikbacteria bacterium]MBT4314961.1 recombination protein RecR [Candidatus Magasanikbacteria bacterium]MBT4546917.1 recombination protein RecR [Candidatus Magasanikbacteria bacterium]MBT6819169.1 recombination protein RecR [Candidatus Magasanikbacteria bacterium]